MRYGIRVFLLTAAALAVMCGAAFAITPPSSTVISVFSSAEFVESGTFSNFEGDLIATCPRPSAPTAIWNSKAKTFAFQRGRAFNEGKYIYTVSDSSDAAPIQYEVWVVDPGNAAYLDDIAVKTDSDNKTFPVRFSNPKFSLVADDPEHPAAKEFPASGNGIEDIYWDSGSFTIEKDPGGGFKKDNNPVTITVIGVLKFDGQYIDGARDSGTLGSFLFTVNDYDVSPASIKWNSRGTHENVAFTITGLDAKKIKKVELYSPGDTTPTKELSGSEYTATPSNSTDTRLTFSLDFLSSLRTGNHRVRITDTEGTAKTVDVIIRVTDGSTDDDVKMTMASKFGIGDPVVAEVAGLRMNNVKAVDLKVGDKTAQDVTDRSHFEAAEGGVRIILSSVLTEALHDGDKCNVAIRYDLGQGLGEKVVSGDFEMTQEPTHELPHQSVSPDAEIARKAPQVAFGAPQTPATQFDVDLALARSSVDPEFYEYINSEGRLTNVAAKALLGSDKHLKTLPSVTMELPVATGKTIAPITFVVDGSEIVSNDAQQMSPADALIHKVAVRDGKLVTEQLKMAGDTIADGTYQIFEVLGGELASEVTMKRPYRVVVYVEDDKAYDLDATHGKVLDPVVIETSESTPRTSKSSSGSCDAGAGMMALVALAALAISKKSK